MIVVKLPKCQSVWQSKSRGGAVTPLGPILVGLLSALHRPTDRPRHLPSFHILFRRRKWRDGVKFLAPSEFSYRRGVKLTILWEPSRDWLKSKFTWAYPQTETEKFQNNTSLRPSLFKPSLFLLFCNFAVFCLGVCPRKFAFQSVMRRLSKCGEVHTGSWTLVAAAGHSITPHFSIYGLQITGYNTNANVKAAAAARERKDCGAVAWHSPASNSQFSTYFPP